MSYSILVELMKKDVYKRQVTPSSQIVGTQAVFNVIMGERYKVVTKETRDVLSGKYGATARPFNPAVQKKCIGDVEPITCRPADLLEDELDKLESEMAQYKEQDEDVLTYALFPQVAMDFFKYRQAQKTKVDETVADTKNGAYPVSSTHRNADAFQNRKRSLLSAGSFLHKKDKKGRITGNVQSCDHRRRRRRNALRCIYCAQRTPGSHTGKK